MFLRWIPASIPSGWRKDNARAQGDTMTPADRVPIPHPGARGAGAGKEGPQRLPVWHPRAVFLCCLAIVRRGPRAGAWRASS